MIIIEIRLPRILLAIVVGASLSVAGTSFQALLRNPLADPYVLGVSSGAALGAVLALIVEPHLALPLWLLVLLTPFGAAFGAAATVAAVIFSRSPTRPKWIPRTRCSWAWYHHRLLSVRYHHVSPYDRWP